MYNDLPSWYDSWKTACCNRWPNCSHCPFDEEEDEYDDDDDKYGPLTDEDWADMQYDSSL